VKGLSSPDHHAAADRAAAAAADAAVGCTPSQVLAQKTPSADTRSSHGGVRGASPRAPLLSAAPPGARGGAATGGSCVVSGGGSGRKASGHLGGAPQQPQALDGLMTHQVEGSGGRQAGSSAERNARVTRSGARHCGHCRAQHCCSLHAGTSNHNGTAARCGHCCSPPGHSTTVSTAYSLNDGNHSKPWHLTALACS